MLKLILDRMTAVAIANTIYKVHIGASRYIPVNKENEVLIHDTLSSGKLAHFTGRRWAQFVMEIHDIDLDVKQAMILKPINFKVHIGGNWHVTVSEKVPVIDIHCWYVPNDNTLQPTPVGIAQSYTQWFNLTLSLLWHTHPPY